MLSIFNILFPRRDDEKILESVSYDDFLSLVEPKLISVTRPSTVILLPFRNPNVRGAIHEAKYHGSGKAFKILSLVLAEYLRESDEISRKIYIIPVPLGKKRRKERGFNQIEEVVSRALRELSEEGSHSFSLRTDILIRTRETISQISLPRDDREKNMKDAFIAKHPLNPSCTYMVVDDVLTTGATLQSAIEALRTAGAIHIIPLALAH